MKKLLLVLFLAVATNVSFSQEKKISIADTKEISQRINTIQLFLKNAAVNPIRNSISKNAEEQLIQIQKQVPKGNLFIEHISQNDKNGFLVISQIKPFGIPISIEMDEHYLIKSVVVSSKENIEFSDDYKVDANKIVLPFHLIDGFILIDGEVTGKKGKFMFDTGTPFGILLNSHYLELNKKDLVASGNASSGQVLDIFLDSVSKINIGKQVSYNKLLTVPNSDFSFIEQGIVKDFLGFIGYDFYKNYEFVIDYDYQTITLYKLDKNGSVINLYNLPNAMVTTLQFTTTNKKQIPIVEIKLGNTAINGLLDTGNQGNLSLNKDTFNNLTQQGILTLGNQGNLYGVNQDDTTLYNMNQLSYRATLLHPMNAVTVTESAENHLGLGYQFLKNYITSWNFKKRTITLFQK
jgi:hypothetical protein